MGHQKIQHPLLWKIGAMVTINIYCHNRKVMVEYTEIEIPAGKTTKIECACGLEKFVIECEIRTRIERQEKSSSLR